MDYASRVKLVWKHVEENRLSAFLVLTKINRQYISGFTGSSGVVLINKKGGLLYVDDRYLIRARRESEMKVLPLDKLTMTPSYSPPHEGEVGRGSRRPRVGVEDRITLRELKWLRKTVSARLVPTRDVVENLRAIKTTEEIRYITKAQKIIDEIFFGIKKSIAKSIKNSPFTPSLSKRGRGEFTEAAIALEIERLAKKLGADGMAFESIVAWGPNAAAPHHLSGKQKIKRNNFLLLDFGVLVNGYHSDFTRTLLIGKPNKKQEKVYNTVLEAQQRAVRAIKEGIKASHIDDVARRFIGSKGFGRYFTHNLGHGVGLEIHELPSLAPTSSASRGGPNFAPNSEDILHRNMIVTVEPGIYIAGWGGVRIEDMVVVGKGGAKPLSRSPKDLKSMVIN